MSEQLTAKACGTFFASKSVQASSNYGVGYDGKIGLYVEEKNCSWATSNGQNDHRAVTIQVASEKQSPYTVKSAAYESLIKLVADICIRNGIKQLKWSPSKYDRMNHVNGCNMTVHRDYANTICPGDYLYTKMADIAKKANAIIATRKVKTPESSTNNKVAWDYLVGQKGWSKTAAAACIGCWLAENGYTYGATYNNVTPPYPQGAKNPYKYLNKELFPGEIEGYFSSNFPGNSVIMRNTPSSLISYTYNYRPNGMTYDGYCGIGMGSWTFIYGAGSLLYYAKNENKAWDDLLLQLDFAMYWYSSPSVKAIDGKTYGLDANRPSMYAKHTTNFSSVAEATRWFIYYENPGWHYSGYVPSNYTEEAEKVYKEFKDAEIGSVYGYTTSGGTVSNPNAVINADAIDALVISLDENVKQVNYKKLLDNHVSGVIMKAGSYFDSKHNVNKNFVNQNLKHQIDEAVKAGIRFGLYVDVRAKSVKEAEKECEQLYYVVSKYPPALGLWLHIMFTQSKSTNHKILDYYLSQLQRWGFTAGCGLYCTKEELSKIDWEKYQNDFFLWYINRFQSASELSSLDTILTPEFFVVK